MRLLVASNMYPGPAGPYFGAFVAEHVRRMEQDSRLELSVCAVNDPRRGWVRSPAKYGSFVTRLLLAHVRHRPCVVHYHYAVPTGLAAPVIRGLFGTPYVVTVHGGELYEDPERMPGGLRLLRWVLTGASHVIAVSAGLRDDLVRLLPELKNVSVISMGVDTQTFKPAVEPGKLDRTRLVFVGDLVTRKGVDLLLEALAEARRAGSYTLTVVGSGPERSRLEQLAERLGLKGSVSFAGAVPPRELPLVLACHGVLLVPSRQETLGLVALEGMACGLIVAAASVGGLAELVSDGQNAISFPPHDARAIALALERIERLEGTELNDIRRRGLATAAAHDTAHQVERVTQILTAVASRGE